MILIDDKCLSGMTFVDLFAEFHYQGFFSSGKQKGFEDNSRTLVKKQWRN